ncbi:unnamed protein product [Diamesa hyperborea]
MNGNNNNNNMSNQFYKNIDRPYADIDFTQVRTWNLVMSMMESQAIAAKAQINAKYQQLPQQIPTSVSNDMLPVHLTNFFKDNRFSYGNSNSSSNGEESDNSSYYSDEEMSSNNTSTTVNTDSDVEIDVEDCSDDEYYQSSQSEDIPTTVILLEKQISERTNL